MNKQSIIFYKATKSIGKIKDLLLQNFIIQNAKKTAKSLTLLHMRVLSKLLIIHQLNVDK